MIKHIKNLFGIKTNSVVSVNEEIADYTEASTKRESFDEFEKRIHQNNIKDMADRLEVGFLSDNVNWMYIQEVGQYISPIGNDNLHKVILTEKNHRGQNIKIAEIECTNQIYSEWISCLCETMWHTKSKVLQDIHGNRYPVGKMCEYKCSIRFTS